MIIIVAEPVSRVYFDSPYLNNHQLTVVAGKPVKVRCIAVGGNPPPLLDVYLGWFNVTRMFDFRHSFELRQQTSVDRDAEMDTGGLRAVDVTTVLETRRFVARFRDHGLTLHCRSSSSDGHSIVSNVTLFVNCQYYHDHYCLHSRCLSFLPFKEKKYLNLKC